MEFANGELLGICAPHQAIGSGLLSLEFIRFGLGKIHMATRKTEKLDLRSRIYLFLLTPAHLYCWLISKLMGIGWSGPYDDVGAGSD